MNNSLAKAPFAEKRPQTPLAHYERRLALQPLVAQRERKMYTYILHQSESDQCGFKYTSLL